MKKSKTINKEKLDDKKTKIKGKTLESLFLKAFSNLAQVLHKNYKTSQAEELSLSIKVSSIDINSLLVDFLSEVLYQSEVNGAVFYKAKLKKFSNSEIEADIIGKVAHKFDRKIKAVSYQGVRILRDQKGLWQTDLKFDI